MDLKKLRKQVLEAGKLTGLPTAPFLALIDAVEAAKKRKIVYEDYLYSPTDKAADFSV